MTKKKYYVVWQGKETGIFETWEECSKNVTGFKKAQYKSFKSKAEAEAAFAKTYPEFTGKATLKTEVSAPEKIFIDDPILDSISVDAAWNTVSGDMEYQGVETETRKVLFKEGPFKDGTNNVGEFLALVHGLAWLKKEGLDLPIYTDSKTAMAWIRNKSANTTLKKTEKNEKLFELIPRAEKWLQLNTYENKIIKWETTVWGEIPADFGRK